MLIYTAANDKELTFGHSDTGHFFISQDGQPRFAGSTSGLPLL